MTASLRSSALANRSAGVRCEKGSSVKPPGAPVPDGGFAIACGVPLSAWLDLTARGLLTRLSRGLSRRVSLSSMNARSPLHAAERIRPSFRLLRSRREPPRAFAVPDAPVGAHLDGAQPQITGAPNPQKWLRWLSWAVEAIPITMAVTLPDHRDTPDRQQGQKPEDVDGNPGDRQDAADHHDAADEYLKHVSDVRQFFKRTFGLTRVACRAGCQVAMSAVAITPAVTITRVAGSVA